MTVQIAAINQAVAVIPDPAFNFPRGLTRAIYVGTGGDVNAVFQDGSTALFSSVPSGTWLPLALMRVNDSGTTAQNILALFQV